MRLIVMHLGAAAETTAEAARTAFPGECPPVSKYLPDLGGNSPTNLEQGS